MVTAGVFLLARSSFIYEHINNVLGFITIIGALTSIFTFTTGLVQNDMERVMAYSTCSQLGYMAFCLWFIKLFCRNFSFIKSCFFQSVIILKRRFCYSCY
jgi:NADH:ubiquinone oxidoreductase subunit 5 (subunit L)/multisubunit Na+/H+ antiporter MnhA subunit